jgi:hypothetical protein
LLAGNFWEISRLVSTLEKAGYDAYVWDGM